MGGYSSGSNQIISLPPSGGAQRGLGEKFAPDLHTGTGNFTVPIGLAPGRNGFQPQLNLVYSTGQGNGTFGVGWSLDIPGIVRQTARGIPRYRDYDPDLNKRDVFILSGAEDLVPIPDPSLDSRTATRYRPRTEGLFARIVHHHDPAAAVDFWEVASPDGLVSYYGVNPADAQNYDTGFEQPGAAPVIVRPKERPSDADRVFAWKLTCSLDAFGNRIEYLYEQDRSTPLDERAGRRWTQPLLKQIRYVDYARNGRMRFLVTATFFYDSGRADSCSDYRAGFEIRTTKRCRSVLVETHADRTRPVREYRFTYTNDTPNAASLLRTVDIVGFDDDGYAYDGETHGGRVRELQLPPLTFAYTRFEPERRRFEAVSGADLPARSLGNADMELVDLHGAGLPDFLEMNGSVRYWRNRGGGRFDLPQPMRTAPAGLDLATPGVQLLDADGDGRADLFVTAPPVAGYFPLEFPAAWSERSLQRYQYAPTFSLDDPEVRLIDLDGDGITDVLRSGTRFECFFNDRADGFRSGNTRSVERQSLEFFPNVSFSDSRVKLADMTGDGLQDIVLVHDGHVEYWPNLGYGNFGRRIRMRNSPVFPRGYDPARILIGDVDGDGVADIVYVDHGEVRLWINQTGNAWTPEPVVIRGTPPVADRDGLRLVDLLGNGTSGVLWTRDADRLGPGHLMYLDFTGSIKPYLLTEMDNHLGAITRVHYQPSTQFYLRDEKARATRWRTPLPFPVQVVAKVEAIDAISNGRLTTEYRYHHGYWDGAEREFRGFGMVEQIDTELVGAVAAAAPTLTKTWFHVGPVGPEFGDWQEDLDWSGEFWSGDAPMLDHQQYVTPFLRDLARADPRSRRIRRDALRTLRGSVIRSELYGLDGAPSQDRPYTVTEAQYALREIDAPGAGQPERQRIFFPFSVGQRTTQWERGNDPLTAFAFADDHDAFGHARRTTSVACPRGWRAMSDRPAAGYLAVRTVVRYATPPANGRYIHDRVAATTTFEMTAAAGSRVLDLRAAAPAATLSPVAQAVNYYDGPAFVGLSGVEFGRVGAYGALTRAETLVLTDRVLADTVANTGIAIPPWLDRTNPAWPAEYPAAFRAAVAPLGGYVYRDGADGVHVAGYFAAAARTEYDFQSGKGTRGMALAQRDALDNASAIEYDEFQLFPRKATDPLTLEVTADYNYRVGFPASVTDVNDNTTIAEYTPIGQIARTWRRGKAAAEGDALRPGSELRYDLRAFELRGEPAGVRTIDYERHDTDAANTGDAIETQTFSDGYGRVVQARARADDVLFGDPVFGGQLLSEDLTTRPAVVRGRRRGANDPVNAIVSGVQVYDNKGRVVHKYEPYFDDGWSYRAPGAHQLGRRATFFYDPRGLVVRTLSPDGSEQRIIAGVPRSVDDPPLNANDTAKFTPTPWEVYTYDANDNAGRTHAAASQPYRHHWNTPSSMVIDALGRVSEGTRLNRTAAGSPLEAYRRRFTRDIRGNAIAITDALDRTALRNVVDFADRPLRAVSIDAGFTLTFFDAAGNAVERRDEKRALVLQTFDRGNRATRVFARDGANESVTLRETIEYGDRLADQALARARNLRGKVYEHRDEAGTLVYERYDFKGNLLESARRVLDPALLADPAFRVNWAGAAPQLMAAVYRVTTTYDGLDRPTSVTYPQDVAGARRVLTTVYDRAGALQAVNLDNAPFVERFAYDAKGQQTLVAYGNGILQLHRYDPDTSRRQRTWAGAAARVSGAGDAYQATGAPFQACGYTYDLNGNVMGITDVVPGCGVRNNTDAARFAQLSALLAAGDALVREFEYDAVNRLTRATGREAANIQSLPPWPDAFRPGGFNWGTPGVPNPGNARDRTRRYIETYTYDPADNLLRLWHDSGGTQRARYFGMSGFTPAVWRDKVASYLAGATVDWGNGGNRLTHFGTLQNAATHQLDAAGNVTRELADRVFTWDHDNRLRGFERRDGAGNVVTEARYVYDAAGSRIMKRVRMGPQVRVSIYIGGIFEHHIDGGVENNTVHVMDANARIARTRVGPALPGDEGPAVQYCLNDHLDSSSVVVGGAAAGARTFVNREEYFPFGESSFGSFGRKRYRFSGNERDEESDLAYHGARYYCRWTARWMSCDPVRGGPNTNLYTGFDNSPLTRVDADGRQSAHTQMQSSDVNGTPDVPEAKASGSSGHYHYDHEGGTLEGDDDDFLDDCFRNTFYEPFTKKDLFMLGGFAVGLAQTAAPGGELLPSPSMFFPDHDLASWFELGRGSGLAVGGGIKMVGGTAGAIGGGGMTLSGAGAPVGIPVLAFSVSAASVGAVDLALGTSVAAGAVQQIRSQSETAFDQQFDEDEREFMHDENRIDMRGAPANSPVNSPGNYPRNSKWYFSELLKKRPHVFSPENKALIQAGRAPIIDDAWLQFHPEHADFVGDFLRHHHMARGPIAVAIPRRFHEIYHSMLHYVD